MMARSNALAALVLLSACGGGTYADVNGTVGDKKVSAETAFWGGPYIIFLGDVYDCMDLAWVQRGTTYDNGDLLEGVDDGMRALLFTYDESKVVKGDYDLTGDAAVDARLLDLVDGALTVYKATSGNLIIDEIDKKDRALGSFTLEFDEGSATGEFEIDWCNNLKSRT